MPFDVSAGALGARLIPEGSAAAERWPFEWRLHWTLRIAVAMCFVGHGAFGIIIKPEWVPYFGVVGIPREWAFALMPVVGSVDILLGLVALVSPRPIVLMYMAVWGLWTALLRPLSGDVIWETLERAGNYGVPLAFLLAAGPFHSLRAWLTRAGAADWLGRIEVREPRPTALWTLERVLRWTTALLLIGHGALGALEQKPLLERLWGSIGVGPWAVPVAGWLEVALGVLVLFRPSVPLLAFVALWKVVTEMLFPAAGFAIWEFIERGGSYAAPVALALVLVRIDRHITNQRGSS
jgi:hypothetical protein